MKTLLFIVLLVSFSVVPKSLAAIKTDVLVEIVTQLSWASELDRGLYRFQILNSGMVRSIDNKGIVRVQNQLDPIDVRRIVFAIHAIETDELTNPSNPACSDPSNTNIIVRDNFGFALVIWESEYCREHYPIDKNAMVIVRFVRELQAKQLR